MAAEEQKEAGGEQPQEQKETAQAAAAPAEAQPVATTPSVEAVPPVDGAETIPMKAAEGEERPKKKAKKAKAEGEPEGAPTASEGTEASAAPTAEGEERPKKKAKKVKAEGQELAEGEVLIETVDEKTDRKVSYTVKPLFGKYPFTGVVVTNPGLQRYVNINPVSVPHTGARHANRPFAKQHVNIVERLINGMMRTEWGTGEKAKMYRVVEDAFDTIAKRTKANPIQVFVDALCNAAPKEEVTRLRYGGINVPKAVDVSASRRLDIALRNICHGAIQSSHNNKKRLQQCLADEIILASKREINSFAVGKKEELERIAASAR